MKKRYVRANQQNFADEELNLAIMVRYKLRNKYLKSKSKIDKHRYNRWRNYCVKLLHLKKKYYDNKTFWKTISPLFLNKSYSINSRIALMNFSVKNLQLKVEKYDNLLADVIEETNPLKAIKNTKIIQVFCK